MVDIQSHPLGLLRHLQPCGVGDRVLRDVLKWPSDGKLYFDHQGPKRCLESKYIHVLLHTGGRRLIPCLERGDGDGHHSAYLLPHSASPGWT